ncbi:MAG TPA: enoyl-CoA hydratase family protein [Planctomycetota bacterium]|nr:enoyl-CoA hydratase family protein [Planctomycetota bacterium]
MTAPAPRSFAFTEEDGVGTIRLSRPERLNALTFEVYAELRDFLAALNARESVRALVLTGEGRGFCSGGDVKEVIGELAALHRARDGEALLAFTRMTCDVVRNLRRLRKPVVAAVNGVACGAGAVIALACDLRIAVPEARFAFLFPKVGLSGADMGASWLLPRVVGLGRATELLLLGEFVSADEAHRIGLVHRLETPARLGEEARALARALAGGPAEALATTKEMLDREASLPFEEALEAEARAQANLLLHPDFLEAYQAAVEKRAPRFRR